MNSVLMPLRALCNVSTAISKVRCPDRLQHVMRAAAWCSAVFLLSGCGSTAGIENPRGGQSYEVKLDEKLQGYKRSYKVHVPRDYDPSRSWPVVVSIHGAFSTADYHELRTGFSRLADQEGFIVLYPNGIGILGWLQHWNAGHCCGKALGENLDDIGFIFRALDDAAGALNIDRQRVLRHRLLQRRYAHA